MHKAEISRRLKADLDDAEWHSLLPALTLLHEQWTAPQPSVAETAKLAASLRPFLPAPPRRRRLLNRLTASWMWQLLASQVRVVRGEIWAASRWCWPWEWSFH